MKKVVIVWLISISIIATLMFVIARNEIAYSTDITTGIISNDAEKFYNNNSKIIKTYDVKTSEDVQSEKQAIDDFSRRGFKQNEVSYEYSINGEYLEGQRAMNKNEKHPVYQTTYTTANDELWTIILTNGTIIANPVSYNKSSNNGVRLIISESNIITGYDSRNNTYYETLPKESVLQVYVVNRIDAETLESLTSDVLGDL